MRFRSRHAAAEELSTIEDSDEQNMDGMDLPLKAQRLLGTSSGAENVKKRSDSQAKNPDSFWRIRHSIQHNGTIYQPSQAGDSDTVPGAREGAKLPNLPTPVRPSHDLSRSTPTSNQFGSSTTLTAAHQSSLESMHSQYYDPTKQPLAVSQQTSESAIRDMALRKGAPPIHATPNSPNAGMFGLKGRRSKQAEDRSAGSSSGKGKKLDLTSLFPKPMSSPSRILPTGKFSRSPAPTSDSFDFPQETVQARFIREGSKLRLAVERPSDESNSTGANTNTSRVKFFEPDIYDSSKTNVYRPPKGAQNWFDGFDISSEEEDEEEEKEGDANDSEQAEDVKILEDDVVAKPVELPANEPPAVRSMHHELPPISSPYGPALSSSLPADPGVSKIHVEDRSPAHDSERKASKRRIQVKHSESSIGDESLPSPVVPELQGAGGSRLTHSRLDSQSVLSLSSGDEKEGSKSRRTQDSRGASTATVEKTSSQSSQRPSAPARKVRSPRSIAREPFLRQPDDEVQSPASMPAVMPTEFQSSPRATGRSSTALSDPAKVASPRQVRAFHGSVSQTESSRRSKRGTFQSHEGDTAAGESVDGETASSVPTEASRMMAVTEEEMILLELMRRKRAAMKKQSFTRGYRLAMREEQRELASSRESTHDPALMIVKTREKRTAGRDRGHRTTESLIREELEQRRRMSLIQKEDVDRSFKMGRFLAMEAPHLEKATKMDRFLAMAPGLADEFAGRPLSGTEIETESQYDEPEFMEEESDVPYSEREGTRGIDSRYSERDVDDLLAQVEEEPSQYYLPGEDADDSSPYDSRDEDNTRFEEDEESRTSNSVQAFSPMQRLTAKVRPSPLSLSHLAEGRIRVENVSHDDRGPAFTALKQSSAKASPAALSPGNSQLDDEPTPRPNILYSSMIEEEFLSPDFPQDQTEEEECESELEPMPMSAKRNPYTPDTPIATTWARTSSIKHPRPHRQHPVLDFAPLEVPIAAPLKSPSIATSGPSPRTPTFAMVGALDKQTVEIAGSDGAVSRGENSLSENDRPSRLSPHPMPLGSNPLTPTLSDGGKKQNKSVPPKIDTVDFNYDGAGRITSMASITSAGEDVLAAWADLGGGPAAIFRRKKA